MPRTKNTPKCISTTNDVKKNGNAYGQKLIIPDSQNNQLINNNITLFSDNRELNKKLAN